MDMGKWYKVSFCVLIVVILVVVFAPSKKTTTAKVTPWETSSLTNAEAFTIAEDIVEKNLKAPSTAKFCKIYEATITNSGSTYTVKGYVDAQNTYGATMRAYFTVTFTGITNGSDCGYRNASVSFS